MKSSDFLTRFDKSGKTLTMEECWRLLLAVWGVKAAVFYSFFLNSFWILSWNWNTEIWSLYHFSSEIPYCKKINICNLQNRGKHLWEWKCNSCKGFTLKTQLLGKCLLNKDCFQNVHKSQWSLGTLSNYLWRLLW